MEFLNAFPDPSIPGLQAEIVFKKSEKSTDKKGKTVEPEDKDWKIQLVSDDKRFNLKIMPPQKSSPKTLFLAGEKEPAGPPQYVRIAIENGGRKQEVYVKISQIEKRLHISRDKILVYAKEGKLENEMAKKLSYLPKAISYSQKTQDAYFKVRASGNPDEQILAVEVEEQGSPVDIPTGLTPHLLMKISKAAAQGLPTYTHKAKGHEYALREKEGKLKIYQLHDRYQQERLIGEGNFNRVYQIDALHSMYLVALKIPRSEIPGSKADATNQTKILERLNREKHAAFPSLPKLVVKLYNRVTESKEVGQIVSLGAGNIFDIEASYLFDMPKEKKLENMCLLTSGLLHMKKLNVIHGDIKAENILCTNDGRFIFDDFGGSTVVELEVSTKERNTGTIPRIFLGTFTLQTSPAAEMMRIDKSRQVCNFLITLHRGYATEQKYTFKKSEITAFENILTEEKIELEAEEQRLAEIMKNQSEENPHYILGMQKIKQSLELNNQIMNELSKIRSNRGVFKSKKKEEGRLLELEEMIIGRKKVYIENRERHEVLNLGVAFCNLTAEGITPFYWPNGLETERPMGESQSPFYDYIPTKLEEFREPLLLPKVNDDYTFAPFRKKILSHGWPPEVASAIERMVDPNPWARPSYEECVEIWQNIRLSTTTG